MLRPNSDDPAVLNERLKKEKVFGLLMTFNPTYNDLIKHILTSEKIQTLEKVCSQIQKRKVHLDTSVEREIF